MIVAGRTFLLFDQKMGEHLWFVLTDPDPTTGKVVIVMLVSEKPHTDKTVRLRPGVHAFVQGDSNVDFGTAQLKHADIIEGWLTGGHGKLYADASAALVRQIREGLLASSR